ncbi:MAG: hypothetical protein AMXMBFR4_21630 [Candidatus Hydrogenedentota bacterium]
MKAALIVVLAIVSFVGTLAGALAMTGNLSADGIRKLVGSTGPPAVKPLPVVTLDATDQMPDLARALKEREEELNVREARLKAEEERLEQARAQLDELRASLENLIADATSTADKADAERQQRLESVAQSLGTMKAPQAAQAIEDWPPEDAAQLLQLIDERARGKILDSLTPDRAAAFLRAMREVGAGAPAER